MLEKPPELDSHQSRWRYWRALPAIALSILVVFVAMLIMDQYRSWENPMGDGDCWTDAVKLKFENSDIEKRSVQLVLSNKEATKTIGNIVKIDHLSLFASGRMWEFASFGHAEWRYYIRGSNADACVYLDIRKRFGKWSIAGEKIVIDQFDKNRTFTKIQILP